MLTKVPDHVYLFTEAARYFGPTDPHLVKGWENYLLVLHVLSSLILGWLLASLPVDYLSACRSIAYSSLDQATREENYDQEHRSLWIYVLTKIWIVKAFFFKRSPLLDYEDKARTVLQGYLLKLNICKTHECLWLYTAGNHISPHHCCHVFWVEGKGMHYNHSTLSLSIHSFLHPLPSSFLTSFYFFLSFKSWPVREQKWICRIFCFSSQCSVLLVCQHLSTYSFVLKKTFLQFYLQFLSPFIFNSPLPITIFVWRSWCWNKCFPLHLSLLDNLAWLGSTFDNEFKA